jgi:hypothetical protein
MKVANSEAADKLEGGRRGIIYPKSVTNHFQGCVW